MRFMSARLATTVLVVAGHARAQSSPAAGSSLRMPRIFSDGMVLQRERPIPLWGWSNPSQEVMARLGANSVHARANARGAWRLELPARPDGGPFRLIVRAGSDSIMVSNVLVGDVWVASGQSNMEFQVTGAANAA